MPRVRAYRHKYIVEDLYSFIRGEMARQKVTQKKLAQEIGINQSDVSKRFGSYGFSTLELVNVFEFLNVDAETIGKLMKGGR